MLDFLEMFDFGRETTYKGERYNIMKVLQDGYMLVVKNNDALPAPIYLIRKEEKGKNG